MFRLWIHGWCDYRIIAAELSYCFVFRNESIDS